VSADRITEYLDQFSTARKQMAEQLGRVVEMRDGRLVEL